MGIFALAELLLASPAIADCFDEWDRCTDRVSEEDDRCWARCEARYGHDYDAEDECTDQCMAREEAAWEACDRQEERCERGTARDGDNGRRFSGPGREILGSVPEIANPQLGDIAMVTNDPYGRPVIVYNPLICQQAGPALCEFYRYHEYGHVANGHTMSRNLPTRNEAEADCWAAQNAPRHAIEAAIRWFRSGGGGSWHHGSGPQRAERVIDCAGLR